MNKVVSFRKEIGNSNHNMCWFTLDIRQKHVNMKLEFVGLCIFTHSNESTN